ncbi:hypothetical protein QFC21_002390 [Naganishia friedmannii]|uniref:Uncharacterized protein n=1 Tax=Naganishia friedmannii TaxID=89922 RepID=A0ACC2VX75_9TREE|nr:hypothetical protein QFC21_002390 [Naganishia friedmannii]
MREREREREREKDREQGKQQQTSGQMRPPSSTPQQQFSPTANSSVPTPSPTLRPPNLPFPALSSTFNSLTTRTLPSPFGNLATSPTSASTSMTGTPTALPKAAGPVSASAPSLALPSPTGTPTVPAGPSLGGMRLSTMLGSTSNMNDNKPQKNGRATVSPVISNKPVSTRGMGAPGSLSATYAGKLQPPPLPSVTTGKQSTSPPVSNASMSSQLAREGERDRLNLATQRDRERDRARSNSIQSAGGAGGLRKTPTPAALPGRPGVSVSPRGMPSPAILSQSPMVPSTAFGNPSSAKLLPPHVQLSAGPPPPGLGGPVGFRGPGQSSSMHGGLGMGGMSLGMTGMGNVASMAKEKQIRDNWWKREGEREEEAATHRREQQFRERERERERERARDLPRDEAEMREAARRNEQAALERERENAFRAREREAAEIRARDRERDTFMHQQVARDRERDREPLQEKKYVSASVVGASLASKTAQDREREAQQQQQQQLRPQKHIGGYRAPAQSEAMFHPPGSTSSGHARIPSAAPMHPDAREKDRERERERDRERERSRYPVHPDREREREREIVRESERRQMAEWGPHAGYGGFFGPGFRTTGPLAPGLDRPLGTTLSGGESYPQALQRQRAHEREREKERESQLDRERAVQMQARHGLTDPRMTVPNGPPGPAVNAGEPSMKPLKQAIEVLNQPPSLSDRNPQSTVSGHPALTDTRSSRAMQPSAGIASCRESGISKQELLSPTDTNGSHLQTSVATLPRESSAATGKSVRPKLDHAANEAEQAHRRQSTTTHTPIIHNMTSGVNGQQASTGIPAPVQQSGKSTHKRKRSEIYPAAVAPGPVVDDDIQIVDVSHAPQNRLVGDEGFGARNQQAHTSTASSRKKSTKHHSHAQQQQLAAVQPLQQPVPQNPQPIFMPPTNHINPQMLSAPPSRHLQVRSDAIEHYLRILGIEALRKHLGRVVYRGTDWLMDGELLALHVGGTLDVEIPGEFLPSRPDGSKAWCLRHEVNDWIEEVSPPGKALLEVMPGYADRKLWGTDVYTDDSDLLAVLVHAAWLRPILPRTNSQTGADEARNRGRGTQDDLRVRLRIAPKLIRYVATERAGILSRGWGNSHDGVSIVVESIERIKRGSALKANSRRNAKLRMKSYLTERAIALGLTQDSLEYPSLPIVDELVFLRGREIGFCMSIASLGDWLNNPDESLDEISGDVDMEDSDNLSSSTSKVRNIWKNDLLLENAADRFRLSLVMDAASGNPAFDIYALHCSTIRGLKREQAHEQESDPKLVVQGIPVKNVQFTNSGVFVRSGVPMDAAYGVHREGGQGWFAQVQRFAWIDKQKVDVTVFDSVFQDERAPITAEDAQATDKAKSEDVDQAMEIDDIPTNPADKDQDNQNKHEASVSCETVVSQSDMTPGDKAVLDKVVSGGERRELTDISMAIKPDANGAATKSADFLISESKLEDASSTGPKSSAKVESKIAATPHEVARESTADEIIAVKLEMVGELGASIEKPMGPTAGEIRQKDELGKQDVTGELTNGSDIQKA